VIPHVGALRARCRVLGGYCGPAVCGRRLLGRTLVGSWPWRGVKGRQQLATIRIRRSAESDGEVDMITSPSLLPLPVENLL
jgi:hypothetical protein